jgi:cytochrome c-type biogenesis protein CcmH/NrfG
VAAAAAVDVDEQTFEEMLAEVTPGTHRESLAPQRTHSTDTSGEARPRSGLPLRRILVAGAIVAGVFVVAFGGYQLGAVPGTAANPDASPKPQASAGVDQALVASLMTKIQADPTDKVAMMQLGDAFYKAGDFASAATWFQKIVDADGTDIRARLAVGAAYFNLGNMASAETAWTAVVKQDSTNVEAHYDLGFLYLNRTPADMAGVQREWSEVVRLAPDSDVAKTVKAHLDALASPAPSGASSAAPSAAPSPAPSAAPSGSALP